MKRAKKRHNKKTSDKAIKRTTENIDNTAILKPCGAAS